MGLKYCGCCNPLVDLPRLARKIEEETKGWDLVFVPWQENGVHLVLVLCGCPRACGDKREVWKSIAGGVVVAGEAVDYQAIPEEKLAQAVVHKMRVFLKNGTPFAPEREQEEK